MNSAAASGRRRLAFGLLLGQLGASLLVLSCIARAIAAALPRAEAIQVGRRAISWIYRRCWASAERMRLMEIDADALDALRGEAGGLLVVANHPTMFDAMLVVAHLPESVCVMRPELARNVFLGPGARLACYIGSRAGASVVRASVAALRAGETVVLFPEGTRTTGAGVDAFKPGATLIAKLAQVPIQTVLIRSESPYLRKGWPLLRVPPRVVRVRVTLGERFDASGDCGATLARIEAYFGDALAGSEDSRAAEGAAAADAIAAPLPLR